MKYIPPNLRILKLIKSTYFKAIKLNISFSELLTSNLDTLQDFITDNVKSVYFTNGLYFEVVRFTKGTSLLDKTNPLSIEFSSRVSLCDKIFEDMESSLNNVRFIDDKINSTPSNLESDYIKCVKRY